MGATLTAADLAEKAAEVAADPSIEAAIFKLIPADTVKSLTKLIDNFADDPDRYANALSKLGGKGGTSTQTVQTQTVPTRKDPRKVINADFIDKKPKKETEMEEPEELEETETENPTDNETKFNAFYDNIVSELETALDIIGDMPLSAVVNQLKNDPDTCKPILKPYYDEWTAQ